MKLIKNYIRQPLGYGILAAAGLLLSVACIVHDYTKSGELTDYQMERNETGEGQREEELSYEVEGESPGRVRLTIPESQYTDEEAEKLLESAAEELDRLILGKNTSLEEVRWDLNLVTELPDSPVTISWYSSKMDVIDYEGTVSAVSKEGTQVRLDADLMLQGHVLHAERTIVVYPPQDVDLAEQLKRVTEQENKDKKGRLYYLPNEVEGKRVHWSTVPSNTGITLLFLMGGGTLMIIVLKRRETDSMTEKRQEQLEDDYPELVSNFLILFGAGLSIRSCFERISADYEKRKLEYSAAFRYAYEEVTVTCREMQSGISEVQAYERFGKSCGCLVYKNFVSTLSQSLRKGDRGMIELLEQEVQAAFADRKRRARIKGDKAGTKLLLPMVLMLGIVLVIIMVPAYLSFAA